MTQGVGIEQIINIDTSISTGGVAPADFGAGLLLTAESGGGSAIASRRLALSGPGKVHRFTNIDEVASYFQITDHSYQDAAVWFSAEPSPKPLYIARVSTVSTPTQVWSDIIGTTRLAAINADLPKTVKFRINGTKVSISIPSTVTLDSLAGLIQTAIDGVTGFAGTTVTKTTDLRLHFQFAGQAGTPAHYGKVMFSEPDKNEINLLQDTMLGMNEIADEFGSGAYQRIGVSAIDTVASAITTCSGYATGGAPTAIMLGSDIMNILLGNINTLEGLRTALTSTDYIGAFVEDSVFDASGNSISASSYIDGAATSNAANLIPIYSEASDSNTSNRRVDIALLAKLSSQNFDLPDSIITVVPKPLDGVKTTGDVTTANIRALEAKNANVYTTSGGYASFLNGKCADGTWADARWWLAWLKSEMEINIFNALRASNRLRTIELTDTIHQVMAKAIRSGGIQLGGRLNNKLTNEVRRVMGNPGFNGVLQNGYVLWTQDLQAGTDVDRAARHANFKVWIAPSEAIHSVSGGIVLSG